MTREQRGHAEGVREQLQLIYELLRQESAWPTFEQVDLCFDRRLGIEDAQAALAALSPQYLRIPHQTWGLSDADEVRLTLSGVLECDGGSGDLQLLVEFITWSARLEQNLDDDGPPVLHSVDFAAYVQLNIIPSPDGSPDTAHMEANRAKLARLKLFIELLPNFWRGISTRESWNWELILDRRRFRPYRSISNVEQLLGYTEEFTSHTRASRSATETPSDHVGNDEPSKYIAVEASLRVNPTPQATAIVERESGVEPDDTSAGTIDEPFDPERIDVATRTPTVALLLSRLNRGVLDLQPEFQRIAGIWSEQNQSRLIESMLLRIPLPTFYAAESDGDNWLIVDGVQRLTTIARFIDPESIGQGSDPLVLRGLEYLWRQYEGKTFSDLPGRLQTRLLETELVVHLIRLGTPEPVMFNIFARINTGGRPLTRQELRHALIPGPARDILRELASAEPFLRATLGSVSPKRMEDREMVLRFIAFRLTEVDTYRPEFDDFLRVAMRQVNKLDPAEIAALRSDFNRAMDAAHQVFGGHAFRKRYPNQERRSPINKALFEAIAVNLARFSAEDIKALNQRKAEVVYNFSELLDQRPEFDRAISVATGDPAKVRLRFNVVHQLFEDVLND
jgi:hypothetical protein